MYVCKYMNLETFVCLIIVDYAHVYNIRDACMWDLNPLLRRGASMYKKA